MTGAANMPASMRKTGPTPHQSMKNPAEAGPMSRAVWKAVAFRATALAILSAGTSSPTKDWRAGVSIAEMVPEMKARTYWCHSCPVPVRTTKPMMRETRPTPTCVHWRRRRPGMRSASTPAWAENRMMGMNWRAVTTPTWEASWSVRTVSTYQSWATR